MQEGQTRCQPGATLSKPPDEFCYKNHKVTPYSHAQVANYLVNDQSDVDEQTLVRCSTRDEQAIEKSTHLCAFLSYAPATAMRPRPSVVLIVVLAGLGAIAAACCTRWQPFRSSLLTSTSGTGVTCVMDERVNAAVVAVSARMLLAHDAWAQPRGIAVASKGRAEPSPTHLLAKDSLAFESSSARAQKAQAPGVCGF